MVPWANTCVPLLFPLPWTLEKRKDWQMLGVIPSKLWWTGLTRTNYNTTILNLLIDSMPEATMWPYWSSTASQSTGGETRCNIPWPRTLEKEGVIATRDNTRSPDGMCYNGFKPNSPNLISITTSGQACYVQVMTFFYVFILYFTPYPSFCLCSPQCGLKECVGPACTTVLLG